MNIPIYRAKNIDSDEYVVGELVTDRVGQKIIIQDCVVFEDFETDNEYKQGITNSFNSIIDPSTLAINFPDMLDSENNPIFASLSEDGKGGDIVNIECSDEVAFYCNNRLFLGWGLEMFTVLKMKRTKIIGIQK